MTKIKQMFRAVYSAEAVYKLRKMPIFVTMLIAVFLGIIHMTPFTIRFFSLEIYRFDVQMWELDVDAQVQFLQSLPEDCYILDATLNCGEVNPFVVGEDVRVHFNDADADVFNGMVFMDTYFRFINEQQSYVLSYQSLEGLNFGHLQNLDDGSEILFNRVADALRGRLIVPFVLGTYQAGIVSFLIYIFTISVLSMLLKFGHTNFVTFKEMLNIMVFASLLPLVVMITVGFVLPAISMIIFNMGTPLWAYVVYKKYVIPGLQGSSNEEVEKKECE